MKNNNKILYISIAILVLAVGIAFGTYAYYQTTITGTITGSVAKWSFKVNDQTSAFNINLGELYPGKTGEYAIELSAEDSDLPVVFEIIIQAPDAFDQWNWENLTKLYALHFNLFFDPSYTLGYLGRFDSGYLVGFKGILMPGAQITAPIYYNWSYNEVVDLDRPTDNEIVKEIGGKSFSIPITIVGRQLPKGSFEDISTIAFESDLLGLNDLSNCSNGSYSVPNKYGYPCEMLMFNIDTDNLTDGNSFWIWPIQAASK